MTPARPEPGVYLTPRGYVSCEDLTPAEVVDLRAIFHLRDARWLSAVAFAALCVSLGLDAVVVGGAVVGRLRRAA